MIGAIHQHKAERYTQVQDSISIKTIKLIVKGPRKSCVPLVNETLSSCQGVKSVNYKRSVYTLQTDSTFNLDEAKQRMLEQGKKHNEKFYHLKKNDYKHPSDWIVIKK